MPHKCLRCNKIYSDEEILKINQCVVCKGRFFLCAKTEEELLRKEELKTPEERALGVAGEVEVKRIGDVVIVKKIRSREEIEKEIKPEERPKIIEAPSPEPAKIDTSKYFYGWKSVEKGIPQTQTKKEIEIDKERISSILKKEGIEDIGVVKAVKIEKPEKIEKPVVEEKPKIALTDEEWLERMFKDKIVGIVSMDIETLKILKTGKYEIDIAGLMGDKPVIASLREGTYYIDIHSAIEKFQKKKRARSKK